MDGSCLFGHRVNVLQMSSFLSCDEWPADRKPVKEIALKFVSNLTNYCEIQDPIRDLNMLFY